MDPFDSSLSMESLASCLSTLPNRTQDDEVSNSGPSTSSPSPPPLFLVPFRWWSEANAAINGGREISGVLHNVTSSLSNKTLKTDDLVSELEPEIVLDMKRAGETGEGEEDGVSGSSSRDGYLFLALISEWMFLKAYKWHNDMEDEGEFSLPGHSTVDFFSLQFGLSFVCKTSSVFIRIKLKDNEVRAFDQACDCIESGLVRIWDFFGLANQFLMNQELFDDSDQPGKEIRLELQVYGLSLVEAREMKREKLTMEQSKIEVPSFSGSLKMNRVADDVYLCSRDKKSSALDGCHSNACALGLTGLCNLGNTCYMNSALQCLMHSAELVDYFLGDFHKDLNFENPLGKNGKLAMAFGDLLRKLWSPGATPVAPTQIKSVIATLAPQFMGLDQHDSQEFLALLLDGLHEDLNRVKDKQGIEVKDAVGRPGEEVSDEHWRNRLGRNNSIVVDFCLGSYCSTLVCPVCEKQSITFDPFMYLSLPLPSTTMRTMTLTVFSTDGINLPSPVTITVTKFGTSKDLVQALNMACSLGDDEMLLVAEVALGNSVIRFLEDPSDKIELINDYDQLVAYRLPKDSESSPVVVFTHQHEEKSGIPGFSSSKKFGIPLVSRMSDFSKGSEIHEEFLKLLNPYLRTVKASSNNSDETKTATNGDPEMEAASLVEDANLQSESESSSVAGDEFIFYLDDFSGEDFEIQMNDPVPIPMAAITVYVIVSWPEKMMEDYDTAPFSYIPDVSNSVLFAKKPQESVSIYKCLDAFLNEEPLEPENKWCCPSCKTRVQGFKKLDLLRLPEILVIHLKRFSYNEFSIDKLETFVDFPVDDFDLSNYVINKNRQVSHRYKLYAINNHYGVMGSGHYTAFIQHKQSRWYEFDDSNVKHIGKEQIKTSSAYVLFYRRI